MISTFSQNETVLWVEKYDRPADQILGLIDELSATIVVSTVECLEDQMLRQARLRPASSLAAYVLVLRGRALMHSDTRDDKVAARKLFEEAIGIDCNFAMAYALLAYVQLYEFFWDTSRTALARAADLASKALAMDEEEGLVPQRRSSVLCSVTSTLRGSDPTNREGDALEPSQSRSIQRLSGARAHRCAAL